MEQYNTPLLFKTSVINANRENKESRLYPGIVIVTIRAEVDCHIYCDTSQRVKDMHL